MGCASSKPSSSKKDKKLKSKQKSNDLIKTPAKQQEAPASQAKQSQLHPDDELVGIDANLVAQIKKNELQVIEYIDKIVHHELNSELTKHDMASVVVTATSDQANDDLIIDVASKAISNILHTPLPNTSLTYKTLNNTLRQWPFKCKNQANKTRICDLTTETIHNCLNAINAEQHENASFDLMQFIRTAEAKEASLTPPPTPEAAEVDVHLTQEEEWNNNAVLLTRTKANQLARLLFLSARARPVIHASNKKKDAYYVNRELDDKTQVLLTPQEVDAILNNNYKLSTPPVNVVAPRKIDFDEAARDVFMKHCSTEVAVDETTATPNNTTEDELDRTDLSLENEAPAEQVEITWENLNNEQPVVEAVETVEVAAQPQVETVVDSVEVVTTVLQDQQNADVEITQTVTTSYSSAVEKEEEISSHHLPVDVEQLQVEEVTSSLVNIVNEINELQDSLPDNNCPIDQVESTLNGDDDSKSDTVADADTPAEADASTDKPITLNSLNDIIREITNASEHDSLPNSYSFPTSESQTSENLNSTQSIEDSIESNTVIIDEIVNTLSSPHEANVELELIQENGNLDPILKQSLLDDRFYNNDSFKTAPPVNGQQENEAATKIQAGFKAQSVRQGQDGGLQNGNA